MQSCSSPLKSLPLRAVQSTIATVWILVLCMQVVIALSGGQIIYFELNPSGQLLEVDKKEMSDEISCLGIAEVPEGRQRASFVVVGCYDNTVRILSLDPGEALKTKATQTVSAIPTSAMLLSAMLSSAGVVDYSTVFCSVVFGVSWDVPAHANAIRSATAGTSFCTCLVSVLEGAICSYHHALSHLCRQLDVSVLFV